MANGGIPTLSGITHCLLMMRSMCNYVSNSSRIFNLLRCLDSSMGCRMRIYLIMHWHCSFRTYIVGILWRSGKSMNSDARCYLKWKQYSEQYSRNCILRNNWNSTSSPNPRRTLLHSPNRMEWWMLILMVISS